VYDIAVIGGGVNGCGIARDAAGRGLSVLLAERGDIASGTSSASTKLVHGGLRYLEHYEFRLVRESLIEREALLGMAPHIIWPLRFVLPHHKGLRPAWLIRLGLFFYDHLGGRKILPACRAVDLRTDPAGAPLKDTYTQGFEYSDCWVDDARLVVLNARDAADRGADIRVRCEVMTAQREAAHWLVSLKDHADGATSRIKARALVNAAGPSVAEVLSSRIGANRKASVRLVKGSHIVVPKLFDHERAYIFQNADGRIVFAIPYEGDFTLIGTTDVDVERADIMPVISPEETRYLCSAASEYFRTPVLPGQVVWTYSGVRPLFDDGSKKAQEATRDYVLDLDAAGGQAPLLNVFGGKITTYRHLSQEAVDLLGPVLNGEKKSWTRDATLPGGDFPVTGRAMLAQALMRQVSGLDEAMAHRLARTYGTRALVWLKEARSVAGLGVQFGAGLSAREVEYLVDNEWARTAEDICWRRTKLGLRLRPDEVKKLDAWLARRLAGKRPKGKRPKGKRPKGKRQ
jgi:glycerol-3-phosphate dehydrogenase